MNRLKWEEATLLKWKVPLDLHLTDVVKLLTPFLHKIGIGPDDVTQVAFEPRGVAVIYHVRVDSKILVRGNSVVEANEFFPYEGLE